MKSPHYVLAFYNYFFFFFLVLLILPCLSPVSEVLVVVMKKRTLQWAV